MKDDEEDGNEQENDEKENDKEANDDVNVFDIFKVPDRDEDVMTIVEGSPGIGKTTFCLKLAYDWAHEIFHLSAPFLNLNSCFFSNVVTLMEI